MSVTKDLAIAVLVTPHSGRKFEAVVHRVRDFRGGRGLEARIEYESFPGLAWAWIPVSQIEPKHDWAALAAKAE